MNVTTIMQRAYIDFENDLINKRITPCIAALASSTVDGLIFKVPSFGIPKLYA